MAALPLPPVVEVEEEEEEEEAEEGVGEFKSIPTMKFNSVLMAHDISRESEDSGAHGRDDGLSERQARQTDRQTDRQERRMHAIERRRQRV